MHKLQTFVWYVDQAEDATKLYLSAFKDSKMLSTMPGPGKPMGVTIDIAGTEIITFNGGQHQPLTPAISFFVTLGSEAEVDHAWKVLTDGGVALMPLDKYPFSEKFGWVQDKFGQTWQLFLSQGSTMSVSPFLLFVGPQHARAKEALEHYTSIFNGSTIDNITYFGTGEMGQEGTVKHGACTIMGTKLMVMDSNAPHAFNFNEAQSLFVNCTTQDEVDYYWSKLGDGGTYSRCGWLADKFGVWWQIIPAALGKALSNPDPAKAGRAMQAMMKMDKIIIAHIDAALA